jgi:ABC-type transport system substrate-binding protein
MGYAIDGPVGPRVIGADPKLKRYPYDPKKAKEPLAQAGYARGCDVQLYYSAGRYPKDRLPSARRDCVVISKSCVVIPNACEGS